MWANKERVLLDCVHSSKEGAGTAARATVAAEEEHGGSGGRSTVDGLAGP
jgi:hypothetical protein